MITHAKDFALVLVSIPLQLLGFTGTCTQGADGGFGAGALLSGPLLALAACICFWSIWRLRSIADEPLAGITALLAAAPAVILLITNRDAWWGIFLYGTACGENYRDYSSGFGAANILIVSAYLFLPLVLVGLLVWQSATILRRSNGAGRIKSS